MKTLASLLRMSAFSFIILGTFSSVLFSQNPERALIYHPEANAADMLEEALSEAQASGKHVMVQIGGNWCVWCYRFHDFVAGDSTLSALLDEHYVTLHVNYSQENMNKDLLTSWSFPQRFGFPVFVVLDAQGNRLHTQNSAYLEEEKSYSDRAVKDFFRHWTPTAISPQSYE